MTELAIESMTAAEIGALAAYDLSQVHLPAVVAEMFALGRLSQDARLLVADMKKAARRAKFDKDAEESLAADCAVIDAVAVFENIRDRIGTLKQIKSTLQTILRSSAV